MSRRWTYGITGLCSVNLLLMAGCWPPGVDVNELDAYLDSEAVIGGNQQRAVLERVDYPTEEALASRNFMLLLDPYLILGLYTPTITYANLDLASGVSTPLDLNLDAFVPIVTDGNRLAWVNRDNKTIQVRDVVTGAVNTYLAGQIDDTSDVYSVVGDLLIIQSYSDATSTTHVLNLATGTDIIMDAGEASTLYSVTDGQWVALEFDTYQATQPDPVPEAYSLVSFVDISSRIELLNPATNQRQTILPETQDATIYLQSIANGRVIWTSDVFMQPDGTNGPPISTAQAYIIETGQTETLLDLTSDGTVYTSLADAGEPGLLLYQYQYDGDVTSSSYLLRTWDGEIQKIADEYSDISLNSVQTISVSPTLVGSRVLYRDVETLGWVIYDPVTQSRQTVHPFETN